MLLRTRFYIPPLKPEHLVRSELIKRLQQTSGGELVLISAPAGYGKTTLVSQWLHTHSQSFAWLIVDKSQYIVEIFWQHIIGALQTLIPNIGQQSLLYLQNKEVEKAVIALLNDLDRLDVAQESDHAYTLVMDDFHKADSADNRTSLNLFLDHLPPSLRVVMTVRQDPALALARRRANRQLVEIQQQDLAFNSDECLEFLQQRLILQGQLKDTVSQDTALELTQATEGWITGIQLSAMSSSRFDSLDDHRNGKQGKDLNRDMADYLFEEVFSQQSKPLQNFLLFSACVEKFCPALTNSLCDIDDSYHVIKELEAANLFIIALDNHRTWFRYHDLFRQFLLLHVQTLSQKQQRALHLAAANWFEEGGYYELAFQHTVILKDWDKCLALLESIAEEKIELGLQHSLQGLLSVLPKAIVNSISEKYRTTTPQTSSLEKQKLPEIEGLIEPLTKRETQVMALVQQGLNNKQIAEKLFISLNTLKVHIRNLYGKMGVENRTQALLKMQG
jgi:LuxR family maltose regulon positive regulatory protein